jgi:hypothetical protein
MGIGQYTLLMDGSIYDRYFSISGWWQLNSSSLIGIGTTLVSGITIDQSTGTIGQSNIDGSGYEYSTCC